MPTRSALWWVVPLVLLAAAVYELILVIDGGDLIGPLPGDGAPGQVAVAFVALLALLAGALLATVALARPAPRLPLALLAPTAAAFVIARLYTYDPYYAPTLRRFADGNGDAVRYVALIAVAAAAAIVLVARDRRVGAGVTVFVLLATVLASIAAASH
jgi:hypothetical protein